MKVTPFHKSEKGHLGQYEDWYALVEHDDGSKFVRRTWDHINVDGFAKSEGEEDLTLEEFLSGGKVTVIEAYKAKFGAA